MTEFTEEIKTTISWTEGEVTEMTWKLLGETTWLTLAEQTWATFKGKFSPPDWTEESKTTISWTEESK